MECQRGAIVNQMDRAVEMKKEPNKYEVKHLGHFDIVANRTTLKQKEVEELMTLIEENLRINPGEPLEGWMTETNYGKRGFKDRQVNPNFFAKQKWLNKEKHFLLKRGKRTKAVVQEDQRFNSLLNEFSISKRVEEVVNAADFQDAVRKKGFVSASFVEPLVGYIDRNSGDKFVIYEYIEGIDELTRPNGVRDELANITVRDLEAFFVKNGIEATDMKRFQFIVSPTISGAILFLIDVEGYRDLRR